MDEVREKKEVVAVAKEKKKNFMLQLKETFIAKDIREVVHNVSDEYVVPNIKKGIFDTFTNGLKMLLGIESGKATSPQGTQVSYHSFYDRKNSESERPLRVRNRYAVRDMIFDDRGSAEKVLDNMRDLIMANKAVSVADFLDMTGNDSNYTDCKYGWVDLRNVGVYRTDDGYRIDLPRPELLD